MQNAELCSHKHSAVRFIRSLCSDLNYGETLSATETAELMETLVRTARDKVNSYAAELSNPEKTWQVSVMVSRLRVRPFYQVSSQLFIFVSSQTTPR